MKRFLRYDNKSFQEDTVSWSDIDLSRADITHILPTPVKDNSILCIDNNQVSYIDIAHFNNRGNHILKEEVINNPRATTYTITHTKDLNMFRYVEVYKLSSDIQTTDLLQTYIPIDFAYENPILLNPNETKTYQVTIRKFNNNSVLQLLTNYTNQKIIFSYDSVTWYTISNGSLIQTSSFVDAMDMTSFQTIINDIMRDIDILYVRLQAYNNTTTIQQITYLDLKEYRNIYDIVMPSKYQIEPTSSTTTSVTFNEDLDYDVLVKISTPVLKSIKEVTLNPYETKTIIFPFNIENAIVDIKEKLASQTSNKDTMIIDFSEDNVIYDNTILDADCSNIKYKIYTYNDVQYVSNKETLLYTSTPTTIFNINEVIYLKFFRNIPNDVECKILFETDGILYGYDHNSNVVTTATNVSDIDTYYFTPQILDALTITELNEMFKNKQTCNVIIKLKNNNKDNKININLDLRSFYTLNQNTRYDVTSDTIIHEIPNGKDTGWIITVHNPNNITVNKYPVIIDITSVTIPKPWKIVDPYTGRQYSYYYCDQYGREKVHSTATHIAIVDEFPPNSQTKLKILPSSTIDYAKPTDLLTIYIDHRNFEREFIWSNSSAYEIQGEDILIKSTTTSTYWFDGKKDFFHDEEIVFNIAPHPNYSYDYIWLGIANRNNQVNWYYHYGSQVRIYAYGRTYTIANSVPSQELQIVESVLDGKTFVVNGSKYTIGSNYYYNVQMHIRLQVRQSGYLIRNIYTRRKVNEPLTATLEYIQPPQPENVDIIIQTPFEYYIPHLHYWSLGFDDMFVSDASSITFQVSSDSNTWYSWNGSSYDTTTPPNNISEKIDLDKFYQQFGTTTMFIKFYLNQSTYTIIRNRLRLDSFPIFRNVYLDDLVLSYKSTYGYRQTSMVYNIVQNTLTIQNTSPDTKHLKIVTIT